MSKSKLGKFLEDQYLMHNYQYDEQNFPTLPDKQKTKYLQTTISVYGKELLEGDFLSEAHRLGIIENNISNTWVETLQKFLEYGVKFLTIQTVMNSCISLVSARSTTLDLGDSVVEDNPVFRGLYQDFLFNHWSRECQGLGRNHLELELELQQQLALEGCDQAIKLSPLDPDLFYRKCIILEHHLHKSEDALEVCNKAIKLNPLKPEFFLHKCFILNSLERYQDALGACDEAINLNPKFGTYIWFNTLKNKVLNNLQNSTMQENVESTTDSPTSLMQYMGTTINDQDVTTNAVDDNSNSSIIIGLVGITGLITTLFYQYFKCKNNDSVRSDNLELNQVSTISTPTVTEFQTMPVVKCVEIVENDRPQYLPITENNIKSCVVSKDGKLRPISKFLKGSPEYESDKSALKNMDDGNKSSDKNTLSPRKIDSGIIDNTVYDPNSHYDYPSSSTHIYSTISEDHYVNMSGRIQDNTHIDSPI